jgi:ubiquinone/menaquinone biosynthesis C-methylase UbiE/DNA-binding transcriptional ArsR family regulator
MPISSDHMLAALRGVGEESRLRIAALLRHGELTVSDLTDILGQSQPRISRHLKLLADAGVVHKHREGTWAFFELAGGPIGELVADVLTGLDDRDGVIAADLDRLDNVRRRRATAAQEYFAAIADRWDDERSLHAPDEIVEAEIVAALDGLPYRSVLDLGTGTGRMLQLLADHPAVERAVGLDTSHSMLAVARANLERAEVRGVDLRQGDVYSPPFERGSFELVVLHQVLHFLDDPARAVREAARLLAPGGRLVIVDFAPHALEFLRTEHAHRRLGFRADLVTSWLDQAGLDRATPRTVDPPAGPGASDQLTVTLWLGRDTRPAALATTAATPTVQEDRP